MIQSSRSDTLNSALRNPTVIAMLGSAVIHGFFVLFSALKPAESQPTPLRIVNIAPGTTIPGSGGSNGFGVAPGFGSTLMVPNGLPPLSSGDVPELSPLPDVPKLSALPPQSTYFGAGSSALLDSLKTTNPPQQSVEGARRFGNRSGVGLGSLPSYTTASPNSFLRPGTSPFSRNSPSYPNYGTGSVPGLPNIAAGSPQLGASENLTPPSLLPSPTPAGDNPTVVPSRAPGEISPAERGQFKQWNEARGGAPSVQVGPPLTTTYQPDAEDPNPVTSVARIAAIYNPDGSLKDTTVVSGADNIALIEAAVKAVEAHPVQGTGGVQTITYQVTIVPERRNSLPSASPEASPAPGASASPKPAPKPAAKTSPSPAQKPASTPTQPATTAAPLKSPPLEPASTPEPEASPSPSPRASIPAERPSAAEVPSGGETPSLEPLPSPAIAEPEAETSPSP